MSLFISSTLLLFCNSHPFRSNHPYELLIQTIEDTLFVMGKLTRNSSSCSHTNDNSIIHILEQMTTTLCIFLEVTQNQKEL